MAADDKTEKATPKRKTEARKKGQVSKSQDLNSVMVLGAGLIGIMFVGSKLVSTAAGTMVVAFGLIATPHAVTSAAGLNGLLHLMIHAMEATVAPIAGMCLACGLLVNVAQVGMRPTLHRIRPDFKRINPVSGAKNVFGKQVFFQLAKVLAKIAVVGAVVAMSLVPQLTHPAAGVGTTPMALLALLKSNSETIIVHVVVVYILIALIDVVWSRRKHSKSMKMTKQQVKEEVKNTQTPPEVRSAIRRRQIQAVAPAHDGRRPHRRRRRDQPDPLRGRAALRRDHARADRGRQGQGPRWPCRSGGSPLRTTSRSCPTRRWRGRCTRWSSSTR